MQTLEAIKRRIEITEDLDSVVRTMKALSAVSIRQYEKAVASLADYYRTVEMGLSLVLKDEHIAYEDPRNRRDGRLGAIVFGSDQGLCGRFNDDVAHHAIDKMNGFHATKESRIIIGLGVRVEARLADLGQPVSRCLPVPASVAGITARVEEILILIDEWRASGDVHDVVLFYNHPASRGGHDPFMMHLLPVDPARFQKLKQEVWPSDVLPTYSMERGILMSSLLRQYFFVSIYRACAGSLASEHASRLAAMQGASRNIEDQLEGLRAEYQQQRQAGITTELLDLVTGYEALREKSPRRIARW